jgi:hypothetical protein
MSADSSIAVTPKSVIDKGVAYLDTYRTSIVPDFGVWVKGKQDSTEGIFLVHGPEGIMREIFGRFWMVNSLNCCLKLWGFYSSNKFIK